MSEKNWTCKWTGSGRRGRRHKGKEYPRHTLQYYDGTHLSMRKRIWSKSQLHSVWREGRPAILSKYIIGLCNKYVGKPYQELKKAYDDRIRPFKKYYIRWSTLDDFVHKEPEKNPWRESFYIDDEGIVRKVKQKSRHRRTLTKKQWKFNQSVSIPDFGKVRNEVWQAATKTTFGHYLDTRDWHIPRRFEKPLLLGTFWVNYENRIFQIPIYTCCSGVFREYKNYRGWKWIDHKNVYVPFHERTDVSLTSKDKLLSLKISKEWIPINVYGLVNGQSHMMYLPNRDKESLNNNIISWRNLQKETTDPLEFNRLEEVISESIDKANRMPDKRWYDLGYGKFYTFMKRSDYDNFLKSITKQT